MRNLLEIFLHKIYQYGCLCVKNAIYMQESSSVRLIKNYPTSSVSGSFCFYFKLADERLVCSSIQKGINLSRIRHLDFDQPTLAVWILVYE